MVCTASGSTIGIARIVSVRPSVSASFEGITLAQRPVRTCANSTIIELDSSVGCGLPPRAAQQAVEMAFARRGQQEFELVDQDVSLCGLGRCGVTSWARSIESSDQSIAIGGLF